MSVRNNLKKIRHEMGIDFQSDMAKLLDIAQNQYNRYEKHKIQPTLETAIQIAQKLNRPVEEIFYLEED